MFKFCFKLGSNSIYGRFNRKQNAFGGVTSVCPVGRGWIGMPDVRGGLESLVYITSGNRPTCLMKEQNQYMLFDFVSNHGYRSQRYFHSFTILQVRQGSGSRARELQFILLIRQIDAYDLHRQRVWAATCHPGLYVLFLYETLIKLTNLVMFNNVHHGNHILKK